MEYTFTLKFRLSPQDCDHEQLVERLYEAGCDDALVGIGVAGKVSLEFEREAESAVHAIASAVANVKQAIPSATFVEAAPDFVGLTEVAELLGMTRQNMRKYMVANPASFPSPVHDGASAIWHLSDLLDWLAQHTDHKADLAMLAVAQASMELNLEREARRLPPELLQSLVVNGHIYESSYEMAKASHVAPEFASAINTKSHTMSRSMKDLMTMVAGHLGKVVPGSAAVNDDWVKNESQPFTACI
jgi:predicted DNA-binding transcriptional regulator AlpA